MTWSIEDARDYYNIKHWGNGYFDVNDQGELICCPNPDKPHQSISLASVARKLTDHDLSLPVLVRFSGILQHRLSNLATCFDRAITSHNYHSTYTAIYPIKVNQQNSVVEALLKEGGDRLGLEAGSKPEFLAVLAKSKPGGTIICNGFKDREFIRYALMGKALGHRVYIVIEKLNELADVIAESRQLGIQPLLGIRVRLASIGNGKWQNTGGEKSKFGLSACDILNVIEQLRKEDMLESLQMMHFHMGSQIANLHDIESGILEAAYYYAELQTLGADIKVVNVGGGLGVDYEGTRSRSFCSVNYSLQDYATTIIQTLARVCRNRGLPHPQVFSESGRSLTAHHAVLITNVVDVEPTLGKEALAPPNAEDSQIIHNAWRALESQQKRPPLEIYHDVTYWLEKANTLFQEGQISLPERARIEQIYFYTCQTVRTQLVATIRAHRNAVDELNEKISDKYFCNFSLFQSLPDHWAIDQIFPVVPISRLEEEPTTQAILQDITCDSDGRIDGYVNRDGIEQSLALHNISDSEPYLLGFFMVGAYQEILGDIHNLFGDPNSVHVEIQDDGSFHIERECRGDNVKSVLEFVHFDTEELISAYTSKVNAAKDLSHKERSTILDTFRKGLKGNTYPQSKL